jgi:hypothetical protein
VFAQVGNQRSHGGVTARDRTDAVRSLCHQCRDLHQSTYLYLSEDQLRGTNNGECLKMVVGHQEFSTCFTHAVNNAAEDELEEYLIQQVMAATLEEELSPPCLGDVADYFSLAEEEAEF